MQIYRTFRGVSHFIQKPIQTSETLRLHEFLFRAVTTVR